MTIIYLESTLDILAQKDLKQARDLVSKGQIKTTELESGAQGIKYLKVEE